MARRRSKTALILAGGGIMGAAYEIGCLTALDKLFAPGFSSRRFDIYIGISAAITAPGWLSWSTREFLSKMTRKAPACRRFPPVNAPGSPILAFCSPGNRRRGSRPVKNC